MKTATITMLMIFGITVSSIVSAGLIVGENNKSNSLVKNIQESSSGFVKKSTSGVKAQLASAASAGIFSDDGTGTIKVVEVEKQQYLNASIVALHNTKTDCWMTIEEKVYDVTQYIPFHPGGQEDVIESCGTDATEGFNTKGNNSPHSASAKSLLANYFVGNIGDEWGTVTVMEEVFVPADDSQEDEAVEQESAQEEDDNDTEHNTTESTDDDYTESQDDSDTTETANQNDSNDNNTNNNTTTDTSNTTTNTNTNTTTSNDTNTSSGSGLTASSVSSHNSSNDCWIIVSDKVYDVTQYIPFHPGGQNDILSYCGQEATTAFDTRGGSGTHSTNAYNMLNNYLVGDLETTTSTTQTSNTAQTSQCTSFTYSGWNTCQSNGTQTRSVTSSSPSSCTGGSPITTQSCTYTLPTNNNDTNTDTTDQNESNDTNNGNDSTIETGNDTSSGSGLTASVVSQHNSSNDCWIIVSDKVYDVTQYIPFHPGGQNDILSYCGQEATTAFDTRGGTGSHSTNAYNMLNNYLVGDLEVTASTETTTDTGAEEAPQCTLFTYTSWSACDSTETQTRSVTSSSPSSCTGGTPVTTQSCVYTPPADNNDTTDQNDSNSTDTTDNTTTDTNTDTNTSSGLTASAVSAHNSAGNCWLIISDKVYDVTQYIPFHPGGRNRIVNVCGTDATRVFTTDGNGGYRHSNSAHNQLNNYYIGDLEVVPAPTPDPTPDPQTQQCTSFTYSSWNTCQSNGTQTRSVTSSSPSSCTGGSPVITRSCTYTPPTNSDDPEQPYRDAIEAEYPGAVITELDLEDVDKNEVEFEFTYNGKNYKGEMNSQYQITEIEEDDD